MNSEPIVFEGFEGNQLVADQRGSPDAWPVLFLHGSGQTRHAWGATAQLVADSGWQSISIDLRGHGQSDWSSSGDYSYDAFRADIEAVLGRLSRPPVLVGSSLGGVVSALVAGNGVHPVAGIVLVDITTRFNPEGVNRIRDFMHSGLGGFESLDEAAEAIAAYTPHRPRRVNPSGLKKVLRHRDGRWYWHWDPAFMAINRGNSGSDGRFTLLRDALKKVDVPTMLVWGLMSDVVNEQGINDVVSLVPHASVVAVKGATHMIAGDKNDAFSRAVIEFLDKQVRTTGGS